MKKIILVLGMLLCLLGVVACGKEEYILNKHYEIEGSEIDWAMKKLEDRYDIIVSATAPTYGEGAMLYAWFFSHFQDALEGRFTYTLSVYVDDVNIIAVGDGTEYQITGTNINGSKIDDIPDWHLLVSENPHEWDDELEGYPEGLQDMFTDFYTELNAISSTEKE